MSERVVFLRPDAERIARAVRRVEGLREAAPLAFPRVVEQGGGKVFRVCTYTGAWALNSFKTITFRNVTTTPNTVRAVNLFAALPSPTVSTSVCAIAKDGTAWYLIAARCP